MPVGRCVQPKPNPTEPGISSPFRTLLKYPNDSLNFVPSWSGDVASNQEILGRTMVIGKAMMAVLFGKIDANESQRTVQLSSQDITQAHLSQLLVQ
jgi:hypothetical protein